MASALMGGLTASVALAHGHRTVADRYEFTVGFIVEPAFEGIKNGVDLRIAKRADGGLIEHDHEDEHEEAEAVEMVPVEGVQATLQVEVTHVASGVSRVFPLRTIFRDPGHYTADLIPTAPGQYRFRFFGTIEGHTVNESFTSEVDGFNSMQSAQEIQFPYELPELRELEAATTGAVNTAMEAQVLAQDSGGGSGLAVTGIALGVVGIVAGVGGLGFALMRKP